MKEGQSAVKHLVRSCKCWMYRDAQEKLPAAGRKREERERERERERGEEAEASGRGQDDRQLSRDLGSLQ